MPAAEERKSLPDEAKKRSQPLQGGFRLHYFPVIPVDEPLHPGVNRKSNSEFQRSLFRDMAVELAGSDDDPKADMTPEDQEDQGPSCDEIKEIAFQKGFLEGKRVGFESGTKKADSVIQSLTETLGQLASIRKDIYGEIEKEVVQLALSIARKIVCHEVKISRETVAHVARKALNQVDNPGKIKIKLNPEDLEFIENTRAQFSHFLHNVEHIRFEAEESIQCGGCLIETDRGNIDARIEKQFQAVEESFQAHFEPIKPESD